MIRPLEFVGEVIFAPTGQAIAILKSAHDLPIVVTFAIHPSVAPNIVDYLHSMVASCVLAQQDVAPCRFGQEGFTATMHMRAQSMLNLSHEILEKVCKPVLAAEQRETRH